MSPAINAPIENKSTAPAAKSFVVFMPLFCSVVIVSHKASRELLNVSSDSTPEVNNKMTNHSVAFIFNNIPKPIAIKPRAT